MGKNPYYKVDIINNSLNFVWISEKFFHLFQNIVKNFKYISKYNKKILKGKILKTFNYILKEVYKPLIYCKTSFLIISDQLKFIIINHILDITLVKYKDIFKR